jgi:hypothetical protein
MRLIERRFRLKGGVWVCWLASICDRVFGPILRETWELPHDLKEIVLSLHDRPSPNRLRLTVRLYEGEGPRFPELWTVGGKETWNVPMLDKVIRPFVGKSLYLQVEYDA